MDKKYGAASCSKDAYVDGGSSYGVAAAAVCAFYSGCRVPVCAAQGIRYDRHGDYCRQAETAMAAEGHSLRSDDCQRSRRHYGRRTQCASAGGATPAARA